MSRTLPTLTLLLVALLLACPLSAQTEPERARDILNGEQYRGYRIYKPEPRPVRDGNSTSSSDDGGNGSPGNGGGDNGYRGYRREVGVRDNPFGGGSSGSGPDLSGAFQIVMWVVLGIIVAAAIFFIVRMWLDRKPNPRVKKMKEEAAVTEKKEEPPPTPADISSLEGELAAAIEAGDYALAALVAFKLFWRRAGWVGFADIRDVKTWRDACKQIKRGDTRQEVRRLLTLVERVRYGKHSPSAAEFEAWRARLDAVEIGS